MTVAELIELLGRYPRDLRVVVDGYEDGYDDLSPDQMILTRIRLDTETASWKGKHSDAKASPEGDPDAAETVDALVLRRTSW